ncbi:hypothetical protein A0J61_08062 [Choanephora cucurbitarum]|uniref:Uncharacterized protein n=1 Tax=Choanephora cucurbitarum TaxID=101091 RepID=A0A1C7N5F5_9FUNG|nr:hypothetical protein A0J61_08062 [Choanephora cucurbitarum]
MPTKFQAFRSSLIDLLSSFNRSTTEFSGNVAKQSFDPTSFLHLKISSLSCKSRLLRSLFFKLENSGKKKTNGRPLYLSTQFAPLLARETSLLSGVSLILIWFISRMEKLA